MNTRHSLRLIALLLLAVGACVPASAGPPKDKFAVFTQKDPVFTETITLYTDGSYQQKETLSAKDLRRVGSMHDPASWHPDRFDFPEILDYKRGAVWLLLDKEGGVPITYRPGESLPASAVVELKSAMPFGFVWENQSPERLHGTRYLEASLFQSTKPAGVLAHNGTIVPGSPLPNLVRP